MQHNTESSTSLIQIRSYLSTHIRPPGRLRSARRSDASKSTLFAIRNGKRQGSAELLHRIAGAFDVSIDKLIESNDEA